MADDIRIAPAWEPFGSEAENAAAVASLEGTINQSLPEPYRTFLLRHGGGRPYPNMIISDTNLGGYGQEIFVDVLLPGSMVAEHARREVYGEGTPDGFLIVGQDPGGLFYLLSLRPKDMGTIYLWYHNGAAWGSDGNDEDALTTLAPDFGTLIGMMTDNATRDGWEFWNIPINADNAVALEMP